MSSVAHSTDIAILLDIPNSSDNSVVVLTLENGILKFNSDGSDPKSLVSNSILELCKEYNTNKKPMFFKVTISKEKNTIDWILNMDNTVRYYILDEISLETVCDMIRMKNMYEMRM